MKDLNHEKVFQMTRKLEIEWVFNVPLASHHGGVWESLIRIIRRVFSALIHVDSRLTDDKLCTLFCQVENILNSRPITKVSDDADDDTALTPNHLLMLGNNPSLPLGSFGDGEQQPFLELQTSNVV